MSWLVAHIDRERGEPGRRQVIRALERESLPRPEEVSFESGPHCELGFAKRATTSRERLARQPFLDEERGLYVIGDICLDNRRELGETLGIDTGEELSDIALVSRGFDRFGTEIASKLIGAFAFVVWDARSRTLYAARDPMGERPLYYRAEGERIWLASSVEQLLFVRNGLPPIEDETVFGFLGGEYGRIDRTFFRGIHRLPPGCFLVWTMQGEPRIERYFRPPQRFLRLPSREDYHARFRELLDDAVRARLDSDRPIVAHLSGGLDSSSIACLADRIYRDSSGSRPPLRLVSGLYPGLDCDESRFIREITGRVELRWEAFDATAFDFTDLERPFLDWPGGRSSQAGFAGDLALAQRDGARVLLSGFGGDDVGSETGIFRDLAALGRFRTLLDETLFAREFHTGSRRRAFLDGLKGLLPHPLLDAYIRNRPRHPSPPPPWLGPRLRELWPGPRPELGNETKQPWLSHTQKWLFRAFTNANRAFCVDLEARQAAEAGVEVRYPFFDRRLASFVLSIPPEHRLPGGSYRVLQRRAMRGLVPDTILDRHEATTFEAAFLARARAGLPRFRAIFEEGEWQSGAYVEKNGILQLCRDLEKVRDPERHFAAFRSVENAALLEAWLRALRVNRAPRW